MIRNALYFLLAFTFAASDCDAQEFRKWTSKNGLSTIEAKFTEFAFDSIILTKRDGTKLRVKISQLGIEDLEYVNDAATNMATNNESKKASTVSVNGVVKKIKLDLDPCHSMVFSPDNSKLVYGHNSGAISILDIGSGSVILRSKKDPLMNNIHQLAFTPDGKFLVGAGRMRLRTYYEANGTLLAGPKYTGHLGKIKKICVSKNGDFCMSSDDIGGIHLSEIKTGRMVQRFNVDNLHNRSNLWVSTDGRNAIVVTAESEIIHLDCVKGETNKRIKCNSENKRANQIIISSNGKNIFRGNSNKFDVFDSETGDQKLSQETYMNDVVMSPNDRYIAFKGIVSLVVRDLENLDAVAVLKGSHSGKLVEFTPNGEYLAIGNSRDLTLYRVTELLEQ